MKKNISKLVKSIILMIVLVLCATVFAIITPNEVTLDSEFGKGYKIVVSTKNYTKVDEETKETVNVDFDINKVATVLENRIKNFKATDVKATIDGNNIVIEFYGLEDTENLFKYLTNKGELTFKNTSETVLMDASVLDGNQPLDVFSQDGQAYINIHVSDTETFKNKTTSLAISGNPILVIWVDQNKETYESEHEKDTPAFLSSATVQSAIEDDCYVASAHDYETTKCLVNIVNAGKLDCKCELLKEQTALIDSNASTLNKVTIGLIAFVGIIALAFITLFGINGLFATISYIAFTSLFLFSGAAIKLPFNTLLISAFIICTIIGLFPVFYTLKQLKSELKKDHSMQITAENLFKENFRSFVFSYTAEAIVGGLTYIVYKDAANFGVLILLAGIYSLILFAGCVRYLVKQMAYSGYVNKTLYLANNKTEHDYIRFSSVNSIAYIIGFVVVLAIVLTRYILTASYNYIVLLITILLTVGFSLHYFLKKKLASNKDKKNTTAIYNVIDQVSSISLCYFVSALLLTSIFGVIVFVIIAKRDYINLLGCVFTVILFALFYATVVFKAINSKKKKSNKKNKTTELKEQSIFGINEVR